MYITKNQRRKLENWENPESEDKTIQHLAHAQPEAIYKGSIYWYQRSLLQTAQKTSRLNVHANTFSNRVVNTWNNLPDVVVNAPTVNSFKSRLNKHWHGHPSKFEPACYQRGHPAREYSQNSQEAPFIS